MELQHSFTVPVPIDEAWTAFNDLERIAPCFPGASITSVDGDDFTGLAKVKLGPVALQYTGTGRFVSRDESAYHAVIEASGKDKRGNGTAAATITAHLEEEGSGTRVVVDTDLKVTGRPAQFGRGMMSDVGGKLLDQFAACLAVRLAEQTKPADGAPVEAASEVNGTSPVSTTKAAPAKAATATKSAAAKKAAPAKRAAPAKKAPAAKKAAPAHIGAPAETAASTSSPTAVTPTSEPSAATAAADDRAADQAAATARPSTPPARPLAPSGTQASNDELDLGAVLLPAMARRYGPTIAACVVTALLTWWLSRRRS